MHPARLLSFFHLSLMARLLVEVFTNVGSMADAAPTGDSGIRCLLYPSLIRGCETRDSFYLEKKKELAQPRMELPHFHSMQRQWRPLTLLGSVPPYHVRAQQELME